MTGQFTLGLDTVDRWRELDARVLAALQSDLLDAEDVKILRVLARHKGAMQAIRAGVIAEEAGMLSGEASRRKICSAVETFRLLFKLPVGGLRVPPYGYFLIVSAADLEMAVQPLAGEMYSLMRLMRALTSRRDLAKLYGQAMLRLDAEEKKEVA